MITTEESRIMSKASNASYFNNRVPDDLYKIKDHVQDAKNGFEYTIYQKKGTNEYIVSFAGSQNGQDVAADVALGNKQWEDSKAQLLNSLKDLRATDISFTGHSLGGAIAQYAAYDYIKENPENHAKVKLCTFNGLGGMDGIAQMHSTDYSSGKFDTIVSQIDASHFFTSSSGTSDIVSRLGGGHLGGNTFEVKMTSLKAGLVAIHQAWDDFYNLTVPQVIKSPDYIHIPQAQRIAAVFTYFGIDGKITDSEGWSRAIGGVLLGASMMSKNELNQILNAFYPNPLLADGYHVRDLSPLVRLGLAIVGITSLAEGVRIKAMTNDPEMTTKAIEDTVMALKEVVKAVQYSYEQAVEISSDSIKVIGDAFTETFNFAAAKIVDLVALYSKAVDYTSDKLTGLHTLGHQVAEWLNDQLSLFSNNAMEAVNAYLDLVASDAYGAELIRSLFNTAKTILSPIILDLDGDGVETAGVKSGAYFDHDGNGFAEQTGWAKSEDGLLVLDKNGNGTIDSGRELFGDQTLLANGTRAANGFQALAELDDNADGKIDVNDAAYANLKIWQDLDGDGYSTPNELKTLSEMGIASINTGFSDSSLVDENGNAHKQIGSYQRTDGTSGTAADVWFRADKMFTITAETLDVPADIAVLPDLRGFGNVYDLHQVMVRDTSGQLQLLVQQFIAAADPAVRSGLMDRILFKWTGSDGVSPTSRGNFFDGRKLAVLEKMIGEDFLQDSKPDPGQAAISHLSDAYKILLESIYGRLMVQTHLKDLYSQITYSWDADASCIKGDLRGAINYIQNELNENYDSGKSILTEFVRTLRGMDVDEKTNFSSFYEAFASQSEELVQIIEEAGRNVVRLGPGNDTATQAGWKDLVYGYAGNDHLYSGGNSDKIDGGEGNDSLDGGAGEDTLLGGPGDDNLTGGSGNDLLIGGPGNDCLLGNEGSDTYQFSRGDGEDRIVNHDRGDTGVDTLEFTEDVIRRDVEFIMTAGNELSVRIKDTDEAININNWFSSDANYRLDRFKFSDGEVLTTAELVEKGYKVYGTSNSDSRTGSTSNDRMYGYEGNDSFNGGAGNDTLYGGPGDDNLTGGAGNDILIGGTGNDCLLGNEGRDTYQFTRGDGEDRIMNHDGGDSGVDTLEFTGDVKRGDVEFIMAPGNELDVRIKETGDVVHLSLWFSSDANYRLDRFKFSDGEILTTAELVAEGYRVYGTSGIDYRFGSTSNDRMYGYEGDDTLNGGAGNDTLRGGSGNDTLTGGTGNDILIGGAGNDCLLGNEGRDTYQFTRGDGEDRIMNHDGGDPGVDTLQFTGDVNRKDVEFIMTAWNELDVRIKDTGDVVHISQWFSSDDNYRLDRFKFSDGEILTTVELVAEGYRVYGTSGNDFRTGSTSNDKMYGYEGNDILKGSAGNDKLDGGVGADSMYGNVGNDVYVVDNIGDYVYEDPNEGIDTVQSSITYSLGSHVERLTLTGSAAINGTGNILSNVLTGNDAINILNTGAGNDTLDGRAGNDTLDGGVGSDTYLFRLGDGQDTLNDYSTFQEDVDILRLVDGIGQSDPVLVKQNEDLYLFLDKSSCVVVENQFSNADYGVECLEVGGGYYMKRADIENIVNAMSDINDDSEMDVLEKYEALQADLTYVGVLAESWQL